MKKLLIISLISFVVSALLFSPTYANHLGPIVFGQERLERVTFCLSLGHALALAREDERSIKAKESVKEFFDKAKQLIKEGDCDGGVIVYTPLETMHQWIGRAFIQDFEVRMSMVRSQSQGITIYVLTPDEAPAPAHQPKL